MMELLNRMNALAVRNKEVGLTPTEVKEREQLRQQYLQQIRCQVLANMNCFALSR
ncbi:DUF896 domain-containing protein [Lysinibacillus sp. LZ02]|uniref:DUF896 domain-containing protein n=1 Tax=Lysinibacillus sp. LZ02 TaxID=3420668 RepID=UPI003D367123